MPNSTSRCAASRPVLPRSACPPGAPIVIRRGNDLLYVLSFLCRDRRRPGGAAVLGPTHPRGGRPSRRGLRRRRRALTRVTGESPRRRRPRDRERRRTGAPRRLSRWRDYAETDAEDPAYLIYTSGTASKPKGVLHAQRVGRAGARPCWTPGEGAEGNRRGAARGRDQLDLYARRRPDGPVQPGRDRRALRRTRPARASGQA